MATSITDECVCQDYADDGYTDWFCPKHGTMYFNAMTGEIEPNVEGPCES